eukprot:TRINITY_DN13172_c0_g1_i1.p1 TRINITY_DN13172_c0_g1~~TRINITY_DN13172_c0_g1_i1.p1  ORF type:complete len:152 (-),score=19.64 TRINITY_DN13172_c0_g1_i1:179-634(-)
MFTNWDLSYPRLSNNKIVDYHLWANQCYLWTSITLGLSMFNHIKEIFKYINVTKDTVNKALNSIRVLINSQLDQFAKNILTRRSLELSRLTSRKISLPKGLETKSLEKARPEFPLISGGVIVVGSGVLFVRAFVFVVDKVVVVPQKYLQPQ